MDRVQQLIKDRGLSLESHSIQEFGLSRNYTVSPEVSLYLEKCLTPDGLTASGVRLHGFKRIVRENSAGVSPGGILLPLGYVIVATSIGGNGVAVDVETGDVYWVNNSDVFSDDDGDFITSPDPSNPYPRATRETVQTIMVHLGSNLEIFLVELLNNELGTVLDRLD